MIDTCHGLSYTRPEMNSGVKYTIALETLGCKVNQAESDVLAARLLSAGQHVVSFDSVADAYLLNACTVTHVADRKGRQLLRRARRQNPHGLLVGIGCGAKALTHQVDITITNRQKDEAVPLIMQALGERSAIKTTEYQDLPRRTRSIVKVQDGCNHRCAYCIVPLVRGPERSIPSQGVIQQVRDLIASGIQEVVLTGPQLASYCDPAVGNLTGLIRTLLANTALSRLRLSSIEPQNFDLDLLNLWPSSRMCRHLHIPLQSGSDAVLAAMKRGYDTMTFESLVATIRRTVPGVTVTTDVICGFPGETENQHEETEDFLMRLGFARIHVFTYSPRPGTTAYACSNRVPVAVAHDRRNRLLRIARASALSAKAGMIGQKVGVLFERQTRDGTWEGLTDNYFRVFIESESDLGNQLAGVLITGLCPDGLTGALALLQTEQGSELRPV